MVSPSYEGIYNMVRVMYIIDAKNSCFITSVNDSLRRQFFISLICFCSALLIIITFTEEIELVISQISHVGPITKNEGSLIIIHRHG